MARDVFDDNKAGDNGGAILRNNAAPLHSIFANTLLVRNSAKSGSAFHGDDAELINCTVDSNQGLAIAIDVPRSPVHIRLSNSIVSNNPQSGCGPAGSFNDAGHNLQFSGTDCGPSITVANAHLDAMYIPLPKSPPTGNGDLSVCMSQPINARDVYGSARPSGDACTIGAAEGLMHKRTRSGRPGQCNCGQ